MLIKFAIEPDAIDNSTTQACNKRLIQVWERFGVLVYPDPRDDAIRARVAKLRQGPQSRWQRTWEQVLKHPRRYRYSPMSGGGEFDFSDIEEPHDLAQVDEFELAVLEETRALELDIPEGEGKLFGDVEGVRLCEIDQSQKFEYSNRRSQELVRINKPVEILWQERFQRFAAFSQSVVIFDRYGVRDDNNQNIDGLLRLLDFIDRDSNGCNVTIYSSPDPGRNASEEASTIRNKLASKGNELRDNGISSLEVRLFRDDRFRRPGHDRHIRFDDNVFSIGIGTELFRGQTVEQDTDCILTVLGVGRREERTRRLDNDRDARIDAFSIPIGTSTP